jgi:hypothetical protein
MSIPWHELEEMVLGAKGDDELSKLSEKNKFGVISLVRHFRILNVFK